MTKKFPKQVFISKENAGGDEYLSASAKKLEVPINVGEEKWVGIYELTAVKKLFCDSEFVD